MVIKADCLCLKTLNLVVVFNFRECLEFTSLVGVAELSIPLDFLTTQNFQKTSGQPLASYS